MKVSQIGNDSIEQLVVGKYITRALANIVSLLPMFLTFKVTADPFDYVNYPPKETFGQEWEGEEAGHNRGTGSSIRFPYVVARFPAFFL